MISNKELNNTLSSVEYICPFCYKQICFFNMYSHLKSIKCKTNQQIYISNFNVYKYNNKLNKLKSYRNYITKNYLNDDLIYNFFQPLEYKYD